MATFITDPHDLAGHIARRLVRALTFWGVVGVAFYAAEAFLNWS